MRYAFKMSEMQTEVCATQQPRDAADNDMAAGSRINLSHA